MNKERIIELKEQFEHTAQAVEGVEFWFARDLQKLLAYKRWNKFWNVIEKAQTACQNSGEKIEDHMSQVERMVKIGSGAERGVDDLMLTRYACYLIAQNADPSKDAVAFAQTYFALQTRKQEILEERLLLEERLKARHKLRQNETELSKNIYERGVNSRGFARIRSKGDQVLFGGNSTQAMKIKLAVPKNRPLADFLPTITITAKNLATEITNFNVKSNDLYGEDSITDEHTKNNQDVRGLLLKNDIVPENLPPEEDIKKVQRRVKSQTKKILNDSGKLDKQKDVKA